MCGIVAYIGKGTPINKLMYLMNDNDSRGGHSSGAYINGNVYKCLDESSNLLSIINETDINCFVGHTRYATHGDKTAENTHPYTYGKYIGVHNGVLSNHDETMIAHNLDKVDVDSKAIYALLEKTDDVHTLGAHAGTINAVWTDITTGELNVYRRNNPLFRLRTNDGIYFSSLEQGLKNIAVQLGFEEDKVKEVTKNKLFTYNPDGSLKCSMEIQVTAVEPINHKNWYEYGNYYGPGIKTRTYGNSWSKQDEDAWNRSWNIEPVQDTKGGVYSSEEESIDWYSDDWYTIMREGLDLVTDMFKDVRACNTLDADDEERIEQFIKLCEQEVYQS